MKNTKSWKDYVPQSVSLYHADYRENLDEYEDLQDRCIRENSLKKSMKQSSNVIVSRKRTIGSGYSMKSKKRWS